MRFSQREENLLVVEEPQWLAWLHGRRPKVLVLGEDGMEVGGERCAFADFLGVEEQATWFMPRCLGGGRLSLNFLICGEVQHRGHLVRAMDSARIARALQCATERFLAKRLANIEATISILVDAVDAVYRSDRYVRHSQATGLVRDHGAGFRPVFQMLALIEKHPLLPPGSKVKLSELRESLRQRKPCFDETEAYRSRHNDAYMAHARVAEAEYFRTVESSPLTDAQVDASLTFEDATLVVAAAGSGKSSCIVGKIGFALKTGLFNDGQILALAYNKDAAKSLAKRLENKLENAIGRKVRVASRTFHSFGLATLIEEKGPGYEPKVLKEEGDEEGRLLKDTITHLLETSDAFKQVLAEWLLLCPYDDPEPMGGSGDLDECARRYENCCRERIRAKRAPGRKVWDPTIPTLRDGMYVRSLEERAIANWLFLRGVNFEYEVPDWEGGKRLGLTGRRPYIPDFTYEWTERLSDGTTRPVRVVHEHFALDVQGHAPEWMGGAMYAKHAQSKRSMFAKWCREPIGKQGRVVFFETTSAQMKDGSIWTHLERSLRASGLKIAEPSSALYEKAISGFRETKELEKLVVDFVLRFKDSGLTEADVAKEARQQPYPQRAIAFLRVALAVFRGYQVALKRTGKIDYADMLRDAVAALRDGRIQTPYRFVLVDEFQDISRLRADLVKAVLDQAPETSMVFCVGDDWQTINRFAGSDVGIFTGIGAHFSRHVQKIELPMTFRCADGIAKVSRELVLKNPSQLKKPVDAFAAKLPRCVRVVLHEGSEEGRGRSVMAELDRIGVEAKSLSIAKPSVQLLMRTTAETTAPRGLESEDVIESMKRRYSKALDIKVQSIHGSKGLEADFVIVAGLESGFRGFPDERYPEPLLDMVLPRLSDLNEEERRLLYVAMTRARHQVTLLADAQAPSEYIQELVLLAPRYATSIECLGDVSARNACPQCKVGSLTLHPRGRSLNCTRTVRCGYRAKVSTERRH